MFLPKVTLRCGNSRLGWGRYFFIGGLVNGLNGEELLLDAAIGSFRDEAEMCLDIGGSSAGLSDYYSKIADGIERWLKMAEKLRQVEAERGTLQDEVRELYELLDAATVF